MTDMKKNNESNSDLPRAVGLRRILKWFYAACAIVVVLDLIIHRHIYHPWESLLFFYCVFGFVACVVLVVVAKWMRKPLMRSEDYYDGH